MTRAALSTLGASRRRWSLPARSGLVEPGRSRSDTGGQSGGAPSSLEHRFAHVSVHGTVGPVVQPKLTMGTPGDVYEREADRVADDVNRMPRIRQGHGAQRLPRAEFSPPGGTVNSDSRALDPTTRGFVESRFGHRFDHVRVHTGAQAAQSARAIGAAAYTIGPDIVFARGEYAPGSPSGRHLLAHELTHVLQQSPRRTGSGGLEVGEAPAPLVQCARKRTSASAYPDSELKELLTVKQELLDDLTRAKPEDREALRQAVFSIQRQIDDVVTAIGDPGGGSRESSNPADGRSQRTSGAREAALSRGLAKITSDTQLQTVGMSDVEIEVEIQKLLQRKQFEANPAKIRVIDAIVAGLKAGRVEERKRQGPETTVTALEDRLSTVELEDREGAANLLARASQGDLTRLATASAKNRDRLGRVGLRFAEPSSFQAAAEIVAGDLGSIVSERWEEHQAVAKLSRGLAGAGGPTETIDVSDAEELTELEITRAGDMVLIRKQPLKQSLEAMDAAKMGRSDVPKVAYSKKAFELVTIRQIGSGRSVTLPAFGLLHAKEQSKIGTYATWAAIAEIGISMGAGLVRGTRAAAAIDDAGSAILKTQERSAVRTATRADEGATGVARRMPTAETRAAPARLRGPRKLQQEYGDKLESEGGALEDIYRRAGIWRRGESRRLATQWRAAASELAVIKRYLERVDVKKVTVVKATRGTKKAPGGAADITVEFTDGTRSPLEVTSATSTPVAKQIRKHERLKELNAPEAKSLSDLTTERAPTVESYMSALRRKAVTSVPWTKPRQIDIPKTGVEGPAIVSIHAPFGSASDLPMIETAVGRLQSGISARVHTIEFSFGGTPGEAEVLVFKRVGDTFVLQ